MKPRPEPAPDVAAMLDVIAETGGLSRSEIAREIGVAPSYVTMLRQRERGRRIGWETGTAIVRLHARVLAR